jgi:hypothetical protein
MMMMMKSWTIKFVVVRYRHSKQIAPPQPPLLPRNNNDKKIIDMKYIYHNRNWYGTNEPPKCTKEMRNGFETTKRGDEAGSGGRP